MEAQFRARALLQDKKHRCAFFALASTVGFLFFSAAGFMAASVIGVAAPPALRPPLIAGTSAALWVLWLFVSAAWEQYGCRLFGEGLPGDGSRERPFPFLFLLKAVALKIALRLRRRGAFCAWMALPAGLTALFWQSLCRKPADKEGAAPLWVGLIMLYALSLVFYLLRSGHCLCAPYLLAANPGAPIREILRQSKIKAEGGEWALLRFRFGFWPWLLPCALIVPLLFVIPYYKQSLACYLLAEDKNTFLSEK